MSDRDSFMYRGRIVVRVTMWIMLMGLQFSAYGQTPNQVLPFSYDLYDRFSDKVYNKHTRFHSSLKVYFREDSLLAGRADSVLALGVDTGRRSWAARKLFNEHLVDIKRTDYTIYADFLPDVTAGPDLMQNETLWMNTRGFQAGGTVGKKFSFYTSGYENQGKFPAYYEKYVHDSQVVPGQSYDRGWGFQNRDWSYVSALLSYTPNKYLNIAMGQDKNFIGDGYRSMLLSDFSSNYPFLRLTGTLGDFSYMAMWASMQDLSAPRLSYDTGYRKKGGVFHYLDWNVNDRFSVGIFDAVIWSQTDDMGNRRGFDWGYASPIIFLRPVEAMSGSPDNAVVGTNMKFEVLENTAVYGQFMLDEFEAKNFFSGSGSNRNKWGMQLGVRGAHLFGVSGLNYLLEYNAARPYTYAARTRMISYTHYNEPLAHPFGANFREWVTKLNYSLGRFYVSGQVNLANYGLELSQFSNYGKNIFKPYPASSTGNYIGQGVPTDFSYADLRLSYLLNPRYNLRLELGGYHRAEKNSAGHQKDRWITFGLRSSFRNSYFDLSSY
ncbi:MAG TPA: gliding motility protein RemB [Sphingobacteriaceae bacterium]